MDCGKFFYFMNGLVIGKEIIFLNEVEISCDKGFILCGLYCRKCKVDRNWSGDIIVCEGDKSDEYN